MARTTTPPSRERARRFAPGTAPRGAGPVPAGVLLAAGVLVAGAFVWGHALRAAGRLPIDGLPPLHAEPRLLVGPMWPAVAYGALLVAGLPWLTRVRWWTALLTAWVLAAGWAAVLAITDGPGRLTAPLATRYDYLAAVPSVGDDPLGWLHGFTAALPGYPIHVQGHPPLAVLIMWVLDRAGLGGPGPAAVLVIAAGAAAVPAVLVTVRAVAGPAAARRVLPFGVLAPTAVYVATSMDALFCGVSAWAVALFAVAARRGTVRHAVGGGLLLGACGYLSYALLTVGAFVLAVALLIRPARRIVAALAGGVLSVAAAMTAAGFWWPDGVAATQAAWAAGAGAHRPYGYFLLGDLAVLALLVGPAVLAGGAKLADRGGLADGAETGARRVAVLAVAGLVAVAALDFTGVTRGEVERIWLPYAAWVMVLTATLRPPARGWLAAQVIVALALQALVRSPW